MVIEVRLIVKSGPHPEVRAFPCNTNTAECTQNADKNKDIQSIGIDNWKIIHMTLDPDEAICNSTLQDGCVYIIVVDNSSKDRPLVYEILSSHT